MPDHPYGWLSLLPPLTAIVLAIATRRVILSLLAGIFVGALILASGNPFSAISNALESHLWKTLIDESKLRVFAFTILMGAMVGVIHRAGGMAGLVQAITPLAKNRSRGQLTGWLLGLVVFFDDYANTVLLGNTLRPLYDRLRISREKLAFIVDSTAAPVAGLALVSTWVAGELGFVQDGLKIAGASEVKAYVLFINSIPYRFYVLWMLIFVALVGWLGRDFGPMLKAERKIATNEPHHNKTEGTSSSPSSSNSRWYNAVIPIAVTVGTILWLLYHTGKVNVNDSTATLQDIFGEADSYYSLVWGSLAGLFTAVVLCWGQKLLCSKEVLEAAGSGARMILPALAVLWLASTLSTMTGEAPLSEDKTKIEAVKEKAAGMLVAGSPAVDAARLLLDGKVATSEAAGILHDSKVPVVDIAAALASVGVGAENIAASLRRIGISKKDTDTAIAKAEISPQSSPRKNHYRFPAYRLYTGDYLGRLIGSRLPLWLLPTVVFVLAALVSFATGTSWGTMGIVMPLVIPLAFGLLATSGQVTAEHPILLCSVGSVLAGAIFGDHCSPISDTTVLSSQASGCNHVAHVWTQLPYALTVAAVSILVGTLPIGLGVSVWWMLPLGVVAMLVILLLLGKQATTESDETIRRQKS